MIKKARFLYHFLRFASDPAKTSSVFGFVDTLRADLSPEERRRLCERYLTDLDFRNLYESGRLELLNQPYDLDQLSRLPPGSLGQTYASAMNAKGLDPEFFTVVPTDDAAAYYSMRMRKTHDVWHMITGFGTDLPGEVGLQAFYLGQYASPMPMSIMAGGLLGIVREKNYVLVREAMEAIAAGYDAGKRAKKLVGVIWEDLWTMDLAQLRHQLGVLPFGVTQVALQS